MTFFYQERLPIGTRVEWRREQYRVPYARRPIDTGTVTEWHADGFVSVAWRDETGADRVVRGPAVCFHPIEREER